MQIGLKEKLSKLWRIEPEFRLKVFCLSTTFFFMMACQAIWRTLKTSIFSKIVGASYTPDAKLLTLLFLFPLIIIYSYLVDHLRRHQLLYCFNLFHAIGGMIFAGIMAHPIYGIANTSQSPSRIVGWLFYLFMESFSAFLSATFWAFANSVNKPKDAKNFYGFFVSGSKLGGILAASTLYFSVSYTTLADSTLLPGYLLIGSLMLFCAAGSIYVLMKYVPGYIMHGYEAVYKAEKQREPKQIGILNTLRKSMEGLFIILKNPYVMGIFLLVLFYDITISIFDYRVLRQADAANPTAGGLTAYYALYYMLMHLFGLAISFLGTTPLQRILGIRLSLFIFPTICTTLIITSYFFPFANVLFIILVLMRAFNYALNHPTREVLYIPTTKAIKFKAKAWTDAFGSRIAKGTGSVFNKIATNMAPAAAILASTGVSLSLAILWFVVVYFLGKTLQEAIQKKEVIGNNGEREAGDSDALDIEDFTKKT